MTPSRLAALILGAILTVAAWGLLVAVPTGPFEFAYVVRDPESFWFDPMRGFTVEQLVDHGVRAAVLGPGLLLVAFGLAPPLRGRSAPAEHHYRLALLLGLATATALTAVAMFGFLHTRAITDDELTYALQAKILLSGSLGLEALPGQRLDTFMVDGRMGLTGKYLPGEPLLQIPGVLLGAAPLLHLLSLPLAGLCLFGAVRRLSGRVDVAVITALCTAAGPMVTLTAATGQTQVDSLACFCVAALGYARIRDGELRTGPLLLGVSLGVWLTIRPQSAVPLGGVLALASALHLLRGGAAPVLRAAVPAAAGLVVVGLYNLAITGQVTMLPWHLDGEPEHFGFGPITAGSTYVHTFGKSLQNLVALAIRMNSWWLGVPLGLLVIPWWARRGLPLGPARVLLLACGAQAVFLFFYWNGGVTDVGPIYHYECTVALSLLAGHVVAPALRKNPGPVLALLAVHLMGGTLTFYGSHVFRLHRLTETIHRGPDAALASLPPGPSLVLYETHCSESASHGWALSHFPRRHLTAGDDILALPRPEPAKLDALLNVVGPRACFYYRRDPQTLAPQLAPCQVARAFLERPLELGAACVALRSSAQRMGLAR